MTPRPDAAAREAEAALALRKRFREVEEAILARTPEGAPAPDLTRVRTVMELMGDPQRSVRLIHLTGTNGKTSTTRLVERILREMGLTTGRFTSPHLHTIRERVAIGGEPISMQRFVDVYDEVLPFVQMVDDRADEEGTSRITYFEMIAIMAYAAFADAPVDVAVVEVGLGGTWDATNVADGDVAVVTRVDMDHMRFLGNTIEEIAGEKSGIIKDGAIAVVAEQAPEALAVLEQRCAQVGARMVLEGRDFEVTSREDAVGGQVVSLQGLAAQYEDVFVSLLGRHQAHNTLVAVAAVEAFVGGGDQPLSGEVLEAALADVFSPGRLEVVRRSPTIVVDAAHNPAGVRALAAAVEESFTFTRLVGVIAAFADKDVDAILTALEPVLDHVVVTRNSGRRSMSAEELGELAEDYFGDQRVTVASDLAQALERAVELADEGGVAGGILVTGSIHTVADTRMLLGVTDT